MKYILNALCCILLLSTLSSCNNNSNSTTEEVAINLPNDLPAGFTEFYERFHRDSSFQMAHIQWPLKGIPDRQLAEGEDFYFQPAKWQLQKAINPASGYVSEFLIITETLIQENIVSKADNTHLIRRFLHGGDDWQLIYYQGVRKME